MSCASSWNRKAYARSGSTSSADSSPFWPRAAASDGSWGPSRGWIYGPFGIAAMVLGFIFFWPVGLAILFANVWRRRHGGWNFAGSVMDHRAWNRPATSNAAFDDWRQSEIERIEKERQKLAEAEREFSTFLGELKRAKDREEFERFMKARQNWSAPQSPDQPA